MWVAALIIAECIGVVPAQDLEHLLATAQMDLGDTTRTRFPVGDHGLPIDVQVVVGIRPA
jgi:hypothetical protein